MNVLQNQLPAKWRNYSPGGKRRKVINIPYKNKISHLRAQGTKRSPVLANRFSYMDDNLVNFANLGVSGTNIRPIEEYTSDELAMLSPDQKRIAIEKQIRKQKEDERRAKTDARAGYRAGLDTVREGRGWINTIKSIGTEARGWLRTGQDLGMF